MEKSRVKFILQFKKLFLLGSIGYIFITVLKINMLQVDTKDIMYLFVDVFGNINIDSNNFIIEYSMYLYNFIFILQITSNYIYKDFDRESIYIFTRTANKNKWINYKFIEMIEILLIYYGIQFVLVFVLGIMNGFMVVNIKNLIIILLITIINMILSIIILSLFCNLIAFKLGELVSYGLGVFGVSISLITVCIFRIFNINENMYKFIPFISSITSWYGDLNGIINRNIYFFKFFLLNSNLFINIIIQVFIIILIKKIMKIVVSKIDIL